MTNYMSPYYQNNMMSNPYPYGMASYYPYTNPVQGTTQSQYAQTPVQAQAPQDTIDYVGRYIKSYDEVKNAPFGDRTCVYLDIDNDRIYIKEINKEGVPQINAFGLVDIQQMTSLESSTSTDNLEEKVTTAVNKSLEKLEKRLKTIEDKVNIKSF